MTPVQVLISDKSEHFQRDVIDALEAGCKWLQPQITNTASREKSIKALVEIKALCRKNEAMLIVEDDTELAQKAETDGVYISNGNSEDAKEARKFLGEGYIIGFAAKDCESIAAAKKAGADYVCIGPFGSGNKAFSLEDLREIATQTREKSLNLPIVVFGEITTDDIAPLMQSGINGIALDAAKCNDKGIGETVRHFLEIRQANRHNHCAGIPAFRVVGAFS